MTHLFGPRAEDAAQRMQPLAIAIGGNEQHTLDALLTQSTATHSLPSMLETMRTRVRIVRIV